MKKTFSALALVLPLAALGAPAYAVGSPTGDAGVRSSAVVTQDCPDPVWTTTDSEQWGDGDYIVDSDMWNAGGYDVQQTLSACSASNWSVTATMDDSAGDGAVKTYPNSHFDYEDWSTGTEPALSSFATLKSSFAMRAPDAGVYDVAYDIWLNHVGFPQQYNDTTEVMIWTDNHGQTPAGSVVLSGIQFHNRTWDVWEGKFDAGNVISFVPDRPITGGTLNLKARLDLLTSEGLLNADATLGQVCYGVELVSTDGVPQTFNLDNFSVSSTPAAGTS